MTPLGLNQLKNDEGCKLRAYPDPLSGSDPWTIGYGATGPGIHKGTTWTQSQADGAILLRVKQIETQLGHQLPWFNKLQEVRQDVLVNIAYNIGVHGLLKWTITLAAVGRGDYHDAADDIRNNKVWSAEIGNRAKRCAGAMQTGSW